MRNLAAFALCFAVPLLVHAAPDLKPDYLKALAKLESEHAAMAGHFYEMLEASKPAGKTAVIRMTVPKCFGVLSLNFEVVHVPELDPDTVVWTASGPLAAHDIEWKKFSFKGSPASGTLSAELAMRVKDEITAGPGGTIPVTLKLDGKSANGTLTGSFHFKAMESQKRGKISGKVLSPGAAAKARPVRGLPALSLSKGSPSKIYAAGRLLEQDLCGLYERVRALIHCKGDRTKYPITLAMNRLPSPIRPGFGPPKPAPKPPPKGKKGKKPVKAIAIPDMEEDDNLGLGEDDAPPKKAKPQGDDPKQVKARLPAARAMAAYGSRINSIVKVARKNPPAPEVQRGATFDDPLFMPIFGTESLAPGKAKKNTMPANTGASGAQDWRFVHAWRFIGPFVLPSERWDPVHLPDASETAEATYRVKAGVSRWRYARVRASGHAWLTDLDALGVNYSNDPDGDGKAKVNMAAAYFCTTVINAPRDMEVWMAAGCRGFMSIWHDDVLIVRGPDRKDASTLSTETMYFKLKLHKGENHLLVRAEAEQFGLFTHRRPGSASPFWMRACVKGGPDDPAKSKAFLAAVAERKKGLPNLPPNVQGYRNKQDGHYPNASAVTAWDLETGINVKWVTPLVRWSKGSPVVVGDKVFVAADPHVLICLDASNGKILWERSANVLEVSKPAAFAESKKLWDAFVAAKQEADKKLAEIGPHYAARLRAMGAKGVPIPKAIRDLRGIREVRKEYSAFWRHFCGNNRTVKPAWDGHFSGPWFLGYSFPTPVTDGKHIYVKFSTGANACFDLDGNRKWLVDTPYVDGGLTVGASPVLADDKVIICQAAYPPDKESKVARDLDFRFIALDAETGKEVWRTYVDEPDRETSSPLVMRITNGKEDMTVIVSDGGTVVRASDGKVLVGAMWGGNGSSTGTTVGDTRLTTGSAYKLIMLDRDHVGALPVWSVRRLGSYSGMFYRNGLAYYLPVGSAQSFSGQSPFTLEVANGTLHNRAGREERGKGARVGIYMIGRDSYVPPTGDDRHVFWGVRGRRHASSLQEELPDKFKPWTYVSVMQQGIHGRFIAHNEVAEPLTPHMTLAGTRVYLRNDMELICFDYTGEEGKAYEVEVNARTLLDDLGTEPPADAEQARSWRESLKLSKPYFERVIKLKPGSDTANRAKAMLAKM